MTSTIGLHDFIDRSRHLFILTGAGCSTGSGLPDYRDAEGKWKRAQPMTYQLFIGDELARRRYWARSMIGWRNFGRAAPNNTHYALARLEACGRCEVLLTQNVDGLHQAAGSRNIIDLHGRLDQIRCMGCERRSPRAAFQARLDELNPAWASIAASYAPDGDADLDTTDFSSFVTPPCLQCGGVLKPDVVFFGENVPRERVDAANAHLAAADAMLVVGSSLMVYSGYRFVQAAARAHIPIAAVNLGRTRADPLLSLKIDAPCDEALAFLLRRPAPLTPAAPPALPA
jgi:NAD-dependent SIR2 family protein deacetylase